VNAKQFFRIEVSTSWGDLIRERKTLTKDEEKVREARKACRDGIKKAWDIYTQDNSVVKEAKKTLDSAIDEAYKLCLPEHGERMAQTEYEQATKLPQIQGARLKARAFPNCNRCRRFRCSSNCCCCGFVGLLQETQAATLKFSAKK